MIHHKNGEIIGFKPSSLNGLAASFGPNRNDSIPTESFLQPRCQRRFATARLAHQDHRQAILQTLLDAHQFDEIVHLRQWRFRKLRQWFLTGKKNYLMSPYY